MCKIEGCGKKVSARGWCSAHYSRWQRNGDPEASGWEKWRESNPRPCIVEGCPARSVGRNLCSSHYMKWYETGDPQARKRDRRFSSPEEAFKARTEWQGECLEWTGAKARGGYGSIWNGTRVVPVHRYAWERVNGPIPEGKEIDHICHNRGCANENHLRLSSRSQNMRNLKGAGANSMTGVRNVSKARSGGYVVRVTKSGTTHYFGTFTSLEEASEVARRERNRLFGDFSGRG